MIGTKAFALVALSILLATGLALARTEQAVSEVEAAGVAAEEAGRLREALEHYITALEALPDPPPLEDDLRLRERIIKVVGRLDPPPAVPEEAQRHGVRGQVAFRKAQSQLGLEEAADELRQAVRAAPWWPAAVYNLALVQERLEQYEEARGNLDLYLLAAPEAPDAGEVRAKIFELEYLAEEVAALRQMRIAFVSERDGNQEIYVMDVQGGDVRRLTHHPQKDWAPAWSPDGTRIAFVSERDGNREIYVIDADGSNLQRLTTLPGADGSPTWSPDGKKIAFNRGNYYIYVMNADGSKPQRLTPDGRIDWFPSWSPNGSRIGFFSGPPPHMPIRAFIMNVDGSNVQQLPIPTGVMTTGGPFQLAWSPDGKKFVVPSRQDGNFEIYVLDIDGANPQRLTDHPSRDESPAWSTDGRWIAFVSERVGKEEIYLMKADGSNVHRLTHGGGSQPSFGRLPDKP